MLPNDPELPAGRYTSLQVPGLPGLRFRELDLPLGGRSVCLLAASAVDLLGGPQVGPLTYWPVAWPAGLALAHHLAGQPLSGARVLELGCGVGISGLGAAVAGARVLVTDNQPPALRVSRMNARRNDLKLHAAVADWRAWPIRGRFDLVVGSDVTYEPAASTALLEVLDEAVAEGGEAWLTDPGRLTTHAFQQEAVRHGWLWETTPLARQGRQPVFLYRLRRR